MRWMMLLPVCLLAVSCAADQQSAQQAAPTGTKTMSRPQPWAGATPTKPPEPRKETAAARNREPINASASAKKDASNVPPKDAQYTLYCADYTGAAHVEVAKRSKDELAQQTGMHGWYIIHQADRSTLFYGYYKEIDDANMRRDREVLEGLEDRAGNKVVRAAIAVPVDAPDPTAPPEWNLANVRRGELDTRHFWTIQIAAYKDSPERKQAAVEAVKAARQAGVDAYYYHGETVSSVCVGVWPQEALQIEGMGSLPNARDQQQGSITPHSSDPNEQIIVAPGIKLPKGFESKARDRNVTVGQPHVTIVDPTMEATKRRFSEHAVNGMVENMVNDKGQRVPRPSLVVQVPLGEPSSTAFNPPTPAPPPDAVRALSPEPPAPSSGGGKLKSIGGK